MTTSEIKLTKKVFESDDVLVWADGSWCYRYELHEMSHMSDDYTTLPSGADLDLESPL